VELKSHQKKARQSRKTAEGTKNKKGGGQDSTRCIKRKRERNVTLTTTTKGKKKKKRDQLKGVKNWKTHQIAFSGEFKKGGSHRRALGTERRDWSARRAGDIEGQKIKKSKNGGNMPKGKTGERSRKVGQKKKSKKVPARPKGKGVGNSSKSPVR